MSLRTKLIVLFITFTLVPLVLFGAIVFSQARSILRTVRTAQLDTIADLKKDKIETFFQEREADVRSAQDFRNIRTNLPVLSAYAGDRTNPAYVQAKRSLDDQMKTFQQSYGYLDVMLLDTRGKVIYASNDEHSAAQLGKPLQNRKFFEEGRKGIYFTDIFFGTNGNGRVEMIGIAPVRDLRGAFAGAVALEIDMAPIFKFIQDATGLGTTGEALITTKEGNEIVFLSPLQHAPNAPLKKVVSLQEKIAAPAIRAAQGENGSGMTYDYHGEEVLAAWRYIPSLRWGLVTKIDASEVFAPVRKLLALVLSVGVFIVLIGAVASLAISGTVTRPILSLQKGAEAVAAGILDHRVGTTARDEVGRLSRAFDAMTNAIDQRVRERTIELENAIAERRKAEEILKLDDVRNKSILQISQYPAASLRELLDFALDEAIVLSGSKFGYLYFYNEDTHDFTLHAWSKDVMDACTIANPQTDYKLEKTGIWGEVVRQRKPIVVNDFPAPHPLKKGYPEGHAPLTRFFSIPVLSEGRIVAVVGFANRPAEYIDRDVGQMTLFMDSVWKIVERKQAEEKLKLANAYNRSLLEASLDPLVTIDAGGKITDVNLATERVTGRTRTELIGTDFSNYFTDPAKAKAGYQQVFDEGLVMDYALEIRRRDGHVTPVLYNAAIYNDDAGRVIGVFAAARDITERKRAEEEIHKLNRELEARVVERTAQLEASNKELEAFSYSVSHDLRAPLRSIDGFSQALLEDYAGKLDAEGRNYLERVRASTQRMGRLIDDLLKLSRVTRAEMKRERVNLSEIAGELVETLRRSAPDRSVDFSCAPDLSARGDAHLLVVALENLLGNAWKFTSSRKEAQIEFGREKRDGEMVYFVRDNGAGFDAAYVGKLFQPFQRLHNQSEYPGTGIGLATVKRIIERHGGRIWIEGVREKGATVFFTLG